MEMEVQLHSHLWKWVEVISQLHAPAVLPPARQPPEAFEQGAV